MFTSSQTNFTSAIYLKRGSLQSGSTSGNWGSGTIYISGGDVSSSSSTAAGTLSNSCDVSGNFSFNGALNNTTGTITLTNTVSLSGSPTINVVNSTATLSGAVNGTGGFTKSGSGTLTVGSTPGNLTGTISVTGTGVLRSGATSASLSTSLPNIGTFNVASGSTLWESFNTTDINIPHTFTGPGQVQLSGTADVNINNRSFISSTALSGLVGTVAPASGAVASGLQLYSTTTFIYLTANVLDLPRQVVFNYDASNSGWVRLKYSSTGSTHDFPNTPVYVHWASATTPTASAPVSEVWANQTSGALKLGSLIRTGVSAGTLTAVLDGTSTSDNEIVSGITQSTGILAVTKRGTGKWIVSGTCNYSGTLTVSAGTLVANSSSALGSLTSAVTVASGASIVVSTVLNKDSATLTLSGSGISGGGVIRSLSGNTGIQATTITMQASSTINVEDGIFTTNGAIGGSGFDLVKIGSGSLVLNGTISSYTGATYVSSGSLVVSTLANGGSNSSIGASAAPANNLMLGSVSSSATLTYNGTGASTNRMFTLGPLGAKIENVGSGPLVWSSTDNILLSGSNSRTLTLGGTNLSPLNDFKIGIVSTYSGPTSITKVDAGHWTVSGNLTDTGLLTVEAGTLSLGGYLRTLSFNCVVTGGSLENGSFAIVPASTITLSGTGRVAATIGGSSKQIIVNSGSPELEPYSGSNTYSGTTIVNGGTLKLTTESDVGNSGNGRVLGSSVTTVKNGASLQTSTGVLQRGRVRYGGNITFENGSKLYLGD